MFYAFLTIAFASYNDDSDLFTNLICTATGYHEHVGHVSDYFSSPVLVGTTLREGKEIDSIQSYALLVSLVCSTGSRVPRLLDNWNSMLQRDVFASGITASFRRFQSSLETLACDIEKRNEKRRFPMQSFVSCCNVTKMAMYSFFVIAVILVHLKINSIFWPVVFTEPKGDGKQCVSMTELWEMQYFRSSLYLGGFSIKCFNITHTEQKSAPINLASKLSVGG